MDVVNAIFAAVSSGVSAASAAPASVVDVPTWAWAAFGELVVFVLELYLGVFHKKDEPVTFKSAAIWCGVWIALAAAFGGGVALLFGGKTAGIFAGGYLLELALSVDNLFVFLLVFSAFQVPENFRHRVLFWGILGAVLMRAAFIFGGVSLVERFDWVLVFFGVLLVFTGIKMLFPEKEQHPENGVIVRLAKHIFPLTSELDGNRFFTRDAATGRRLATRLFLVLLIIEATDVVFAVDSIPAVLGILPRKMPYEEKMFITFTSNIFAVLGLRSLFFALSGFMGLFRFLKYGLVVILVFIGVKMLLAETGGFLAACGVTGVPEFHVPTGISLGVVAGVLAVTVAVSLAFPEKK
jgi:tellurite resistance protein TerC